MARRSSEKTYGPGKDGAEVILFVINGGGHAWPGRNARRSVPRQIDPEHLGQRPDVGVLQAASDEVDRRPEEQHLTQEPMVCDRQGRPGRPTLCFTRDLTPCIE